LEVIIGKEFTGLCSKITRIKQTGCDVWLEGTVLSLEATVMSQIFSSHHFSLCIWRKAGDMACSNKRYINWAVS
jgi:hypothetical protein